MKTIQQHLKKIRQIERKNKRHFVIGKFLCKIGFHSDAYKDENGGIFYSGECKYCKTPCK